MTTEHIPAARPEADGATAVDLIIDARDVVKTYRTDDVVVNALQGVSFHVKRGEMVALIGASGDARRRSSSGSGSHAARIHASDGAMTANGFPPGRPLPIRSRRTARPSRASHTSWYPPSPFTATIAPPRIRSAAAAMKSSGEAMISYPAE